jgi:hypothetical protein
MNLTQSDMLGLDNKNKSNKSNSFEENEEDPDSVNVSQIEGYNSNWTLRKCCSKFLDRVSSIYPQPVLDIIKPYLEENMQNNDWNVK